jgi:hypothetical protein
MNYERGEVAGGVDFLRGRVISAEGMAGEVGVGFFAEGFIFPTKCLLLLLLKLRNGC